MNDRISKSILSTESPILTASVEQECQQLIDRLTALIGAYSIPGLDIRVALEHSRKDVQALAAANRQVLYGVYAGLAQEGELLGRTIQEMLQFIQNLSKSGSVNGLKESQMSVLIEGIEAVLVTMQEVAKSIAAANTEALDILQQRLSERVDEIERIIENTAE